MPLSATGTAYHAARRHTPRAKPLSGGDTARPLTAARGLGGLAVFGTELQTVGDPKLVVDRRQVVLDGLVAQSAGGCDFPGRFQAQHGFENLTFAGGERRVSC